MRDNAPPVNSPEFLVGDLLQTGKRITKLDDFSMSRLKKNSCLLHLRLPQTRLRNFFPRSPAVDNFFSV